MASKTRKSPKGRSVTPDGGTEPAAGWWRRIAARGNPPKAGTAEPPRNWVADWTVNILVLLFGMTTVVQAFVVPTGSMESNILIGDHVLVDKLAYSPPGPLGRYLLPYQEVKRGDIIVFRFPLDMSQSYVKRVIGLPGDRLRLVNKRVYLNGRELTEPYVQHVDPRSDPYRDDFPGVPNRYVTPRALQMLRDHVVNGELLVPPGMYFAMGDNRDDSADSRYWGFVPKENITGKPVIIYWSYDAPTSRLAEATPGLEHLADLAKNFFVKTRWRRTFQLVRAHPVN